MMRQMRMMGPHQLVTVSTRHIIVVVVIVVITIVVVVIAIIIVVVINIAILIVWRVENFSHLVTQIATVCTASLRVNELNGTNEVAYKDITHLYIIIKIRLYIIIKMNEDRYVSIYYY